MSSTFEQLPLAVQLRDDATFDNYYAGDNGLVVDQLRQQLQSGELFLYIFGAQGSGRSHLLQAACHHANQVGSAALYLPLKELKDYPPEELFEGLEALDLVCLDDVDAVVGNDDWERALFHLFNRLRENRCCLVVSANVSVRELDVALKDLASRLGWGVVLQIAALNESQQLEAIKRRAHNRGLQLPDDVARFIYHRCQRDIESLLRVLDQLDQASLREQRRLTLPFVKSVMGW